jgi:hypothetical protein
MSHPSSKSTEKMIPVFIGINRQHVMAKANIEQTPAVTGKDDSGKTVEIEPARVAITIVAEGGHAQLFGDFVAMDEIIGLSFDAVPATPKKENS